MSNDLRARAEALHRSGDYAGAIALYRELAIRAPRDFRLQHLLGVALLQSGDAAAAVAQIDLALALDPNAPDAWLHRGVALFELKRLAEAITSYDRALALLPDYANALNNRANALLALGRHAEALAGYDRALRLQPGFADGWSNRAEVLQALGRNSEALASCERALTLDARNIAARFRHGVLSLALRRFPGALSDFNHVVAMAPDHVAAWVNRGITLGELQDGEGALESFNRALALAPGNAEALFGRGNIYRRGGKPDEACADYAKVLETSPSNLDARHALGLTLRALKRPREAKAAFADVLARDPSHRYALGMLVSCLQDLCDWQELAARLPQVEEGIRAGHIVVSPLALLGLSDDAALHRKAAALYRDEVLGDPRLPAPAPAGQGRIRLAYLSADFYEHATAELTADLFALHDRAQFEVIGISFGGNDDGEMRARLRGGFDQFHDVQKLSDPDVVRMLRDMKVDIAIDLKGYTHGARSGILAARPAAVQVSYLGYPGTMATSFIDHILADAQVLPLDRQPFYSEKIVHLPDCYQVNSRKPLGPAPTRRSQGLPDGAFVFACFNAAWKITAPLFDVWMRLLAAVPESVLWLAPAGDDTSANLRAAAQVHGIDPARLIFAAHLPQGEHLARLQLADLSLDTLPYNAHTTASDALWAGVPHLTCQGQSFAARVAASLLTNLELPDLITQDLESYQAWGLALARDPARLAEVRARLWKNRSSTPLFDTARFCRNLEAAYRTMLGRSGT